MLFPKAKQILQPVWWFDFPAPRFLIENTCVMSDIVNLKP